MSDDTLTVALITEVFPGRSGPERLRALLAEAREGGAELALLPELPLDRWAPASREPSDGDAEPPGGKRHQQLARAARSARIAILGGAIVVDPKSGRRHNTALLFDASGELLGSYCKVHLPQEEGFWEASHYQPGDRTAQPITGLALAIGVQVCSDANRPQGSNVLGALGAELVVVPRATPAESYSRWRLVLRANAVTSSAYVASINRPRPESGAPIGGPSLVVAPDGEVVLEAEEPLATVKLERSVVERARAEYPGYLAIRADLYAEGWERVAARARSRGCRLKV